MSSSLGGTSRGVTLMEVVVALALLAGLLVSAAGMLGQGRHQLRAAAHASQALAVIRAVLEQLELRSPDDVLRTLGCDGEARECRVASGDEPVASWHRLAEAGLAAPRLEIHVVALGAGTLDAAPALRIAVRLIWSDGQRRRRLRVTTVRV